VGTASSNIRSKLAFGSDFSLDDPVDVYSTVSIKKAE